MDLPRLSYSKVQDQVTSEFTKKKVSALGRFVYLILGTCLYPNSSIAKASYKTLVEKTGLSSEVTISKHLKELKEKGFISSMGSSDYRLWVGIFKGLKEAEISTPQRTQNTTSPVVKSTTGDVVPHASALLKPNTTKEQTTSDAVFSKINLGENSVFKTIQANTLQKWVKKFGEEKVIKTLETLEVQYKGKTIKSTVEGLTYTALVEGDWVVNQPIVLEKPKNEAEIKQAEKIIALLETEQDKEEEEEDRLYEAYRKDSRVREEAITLLQESKYTGRYDEKDFKFRIFLRAKIIQIAKQRELVYAN